MVIQQVQRALNKTLCIRSLDFFLFSFFFVCSGPADGGDLPTYRNTRGHGAPHCPDLLQHLPGQPEPHQPDHRQGHPHTDAERHLHPHGKPGCQFNTVALHFCEASVLQLI